MKTIQKLTILGLLASLCAFAQTALVATTLSGNITQNARSLVVASATGISAGSVTAGTVGSQLYVVDVGQTVGEVMTVSSVSSTTIGVIRNSSAVVPHTSGAMILVGQPQQFYKYNPTGRCVTASTAVTPWVNTITGQQWLCSTITSTWTPGWGNFAAAPEMGTLVASVAGATAVNAPAQHINGTNAITSFTMGVGWNGQGFCIYPDAAFTITATNNIAKAATAVADRTLCFQYDATNAKFAPSY